MHFAVHTSRRRFSCGVAGVLVYRWFVPTAAAGVPLFVCRWCGVAGVAGDNRRRCAAAGLFWPLVCRRRIAKEKNKIIIEFSTNTKFAGRLRKCFGGIFSSEKKYFVWRFSGRNFIFVRKTFFLGERI